MPLLFLSLLVLLGIAASIPAPQKAKAALTLSSTTAPADCHNSCRNVSSQIRCLTVLRCGTSATLAVRPVPPNRNQRRGVTPAMLLAMHRRYRAEALKRGRRVDVLFLGDSITESYRGTDFGLPCPADRCRNVSGVFRRHFGGRALAFGIAADETQHVLWRLQEGELGRLQPKVVVLLIGTNNFGLGYMTFLEVAQGVAAVVEYLLKILTSSKVVVMGVLPREKHATFASSIQRTNALLRAMCEGHQRLEFVDCGRGFLDTTGRVNRTRMPDLLHPGAIGLDVMFGDCLGPVVQRSLSRPSSTSE